MYIDTVYVLLYQSSTCCLESTLIIVFGRLIALKTKHRNQLLKEHIIISSTYNKILFFGNYIAIDIAIYVYCYIAIVHT